LPELPQIEKLIEPGLARDEDRAARAVAAIVGATVAERREDAALMTERATLAVDLFHQLGWPLYEARALELLGRFTEAHAIYESCGATFDVRRIAQRAAGDAPPGAVQLLSARERAVAELITAGLTNAAIAERLGVSWKTVEKHVSSIFTKLGVRSRAQVAALLVRNRAGVEPDIPLGAAR
jgi:DNA-binding CsgD family transcriptional regulator